MICPRLEICYNKSDMKIKNATGIACDRRAVRGRAKRAALKKIICAALAAACALTAACAAACGGDEVVQHGIDIAPAPAPVYPEESAERLENGIYRLMCAAALKENGMTSLPQATAENLAGYAASATRAVLNEGFSAADAARLADIVCSLADEGGLPDATPAELIRVYGRLASAIGFEDTGRLCYTFALCYYDICRERDLKRYEEYGYPYLLERAQQLAEEKAAMETLVGRDNFAAALRAACALGVLAAVPAGDEGADMLTDGEILSLIQAQSFTSIRLTDDGWLTLLSFARRLADGSYAGELMNIAFERGDADVMAADMNELAELLQTVQSRMTAEQAAMLREGDADALLSSVFAAFGEGEWRTFYALCAYFSAAEYDEAAQDRFGQEYADFKAGLPSVSAGELESAAGERGFIELLKGYAAGIAPAAAFLFFG